MSEENKVNKTGKLLGVLSTGIGIAAILVARLWLLVPSSSSWSLMIPAACSAASIVLGLVAKRLGDKGATPTVGIILGIIGLVYYLLTIGLATFFWMSFAYSKT